MRARERLVRGQPAWPCSITRGSQRPLHWRTIGYLINKLWSVILIPPVLGSIVSVGGSLVHGLASVKWRPEFKPHLGWPFCYLNLSNLEALHYIYRHLRLLPKCQYRIVMKFWKWALVRAKLLQLFSSQMLRLEYEITTGTLYYRQKKKKWAKQLLGFIIQHVFRRICITVFSEIDRENF